MMIPVLSRSLLRLGIQPARERSQRFRNSFSGHVVKVRSQAGCQRTWNFERIEQRAGRMTHCAAFVDTPAMRTALERRPGSGQASQI